MVLSGTNMWSARARRWARAAGGALCAATALAAAGPAWAGTVEGPTRPVPAGDWTDCGDGRGGFERLTTVGTGPATGHTRHEHRYCPTRAATVTYYFYAYDSSFRNICDRPERPCDPAVPFGAYAAVSLAMEPGDFEPGGRCHDDGCPVVAPLPASDAPAIRLVLAETVDDRGRYGLTHFVRWDPTPIPEPEPPSPEPPSPEPPSPEPPSSDPPASEPPASEPPAPDPPAAEPPAYEPPSIDPPPEPPLPDPPPALAPGEPAPEPPAPGDPPAEEPAVDPPPTGA